MTLQGSHAHLQARSALWPSLDHTRVTHRGQLLGMGPQAGGLQEEPRSSLHCFSFLFLKFVLTKPQHLFSSVIQVLPLILQINVLSTFRNSALKPAQLSSLNSEEKVIPESFHEKSSYLCIV